ncbi:hypothetical protein AA0114_g1800 [Alternaria tenuissima]|uniref:Uncharacterized protein n=1 Tax=Alternaria tenuissima TaxID=119927 RepID=A0A4Q4MTS4_9PLEO|nr:hypothetical protein AA0114_g1800 [Alternaria tenuissima]
MTSVTINNLTVHWEELVTSVQCMSSTENVELFENWVKHLNNKQTDRDLFSLLVATKNCRCSDLRDRVYGLMSLVPGEEREHFPIDYNISVQQLYSGLAMHWLVGQKEYKSPSSTEILRLASLPKITPFLPSWVPDWAPQPSGDADRGRAQSVPLTFHLDTTYLKRSPLRIDWFKSSKLDESEHGWTLDGNTLIDDHFLYALRDMPDTIRHITDTATMVVHAFQILSVSMGIVELKDPHGELLYGLELTKSVPVPAGKKDPIQCHIDVRVLPRWKAAVALERHADTILSLHGPFRVVCAPSKALNPPSLTTRGICQRLDSLDAGIVEDWLMNLFFYGNCAGAAFTSAPRGLRIQALWTYQFPIALRTCQEFNFSCDMSVGEVRQEYMLALLMEMRKGVMEFVTANEIPRHFPRDYVRKSRGRYRYDGRSPVLFRKRIRDVDLAIGIRQAQDTNMWTASSPEAMHTYLQDSLKGCRASCEKYHALVAALIDSYDSEFQPSISIDESSMHAPPYALLEPIKNYQDEQNWRLGDTPFHNMVINNAWQLLQSLEIKAEFTFKQNLNIMWIHVLTIEMVTRLRGVLQQRLILKALANTTRKAEKIYLI